MDSDVAVAVDVDVVVISGKRTGVGHERLASFTRVADNTAARFFVAIEAQLSRTPPPALTGCEAQLPLPPIGVGEAPIVLTLLEVGEEKREKLTSHFYQQGKRKKHCY